MKTKFTTDPVHIFIAAMLFLFAVVAMCSIFIGCTGELTVERKPAPASFVDESEAPKPAPPSEPSPPEDFEDSVRDEPKFAAAPPTVAKCCDAIGCSCSESQCLCSPSDRCCDSCPCGKPRLPWNGQPLYPTPFWCYECRDFSYWLAPVTCQKTRCKHCGKFQAVRTRFESQMPFRGALLNYRPQGNC